MTYLDILHTQLPIDEGVDDRPYTDTVGKLTIGVGRNLTDVGLSEDEISLLFKNDVARAEALARELVPRFDALAEARKAVLCNMAFNLGGGLRAFEKFLAAVNAGDWDRAADEMMSSLWAREVGARADRLENSMRGGA